MSDYPKWVQREQHIGPVLCRNEKEERELLNSWASEQEAKAEEEARIKAEAEKQDASDAEEASKVVLKKGK